MKPIDDAGAPELQMPGPRLSPAQWPGEQRTRLSRAVGYAELFDCVTACCRQIVGEDFVECALGLADPEDPEFYLPLRSHVPLRPPIKKPREGDTDMLTLGMAADEPLVFVDRIDRLDSRGRRAPENQPAASAAQRQPAGGGAMASPADRQLPPWMTIPLRRDAAGERVGVLAVRAQPWQGVGPPPYIEALQRLADDIAWAAVACHRHELREQCLQEQQDIFRISSRLQTVRELKQLLLEVCDCLIRSFGFDRAAVLLYDDNGQSALDERREELADRELKWAAALGFDEGAVAVDSRIAPQGVLADAMRDGQPRMIRMAREDRVSTAFLEHATASRMADAFQIAILPLQAKGRPIGALWADHRFDRGQLGARRLATLGLFAGQAALAIENARLYGRVEAMAKTDSLTSLLNRHSFDEALEREIARVRRYGHDLCLMMIDLRDFKRFNDRYGHLVGDDMLRRVARILKENVRAYDIVARFGGDEFVILMPNTNLQQAGWVKRRIENAAREASKALPDPQQRIELSIGIREAERDNPEKILADADTAMYEDKSVQARQTLIHALLSDSLSDLSRAEPFIGNIVRVLREKEPFYLPHARRVLNHARSIAEILGLDAAEIEAVCLGALLHDLGKVALNASLLQKPAPLSPREYQLVQTHAALGADLIAGVPYLEPVRLVVRRHHERFDGRATGQFPGYPDGIAGEEIALAARIVKVADCYDFLTSTRPYHRAIAPSDAARIIRAEAGQAFDPKVVAAFSTHGKSDAATIFE